LSAGYQWGRFFLALRLARRELRGGLTGFRVFLACLALGVAAISGVGSVSEAMMAGLRADGRVLLGGDLDLRINHREATAEQLAWLQDHGQVSTIAGLRTMAKATGPEAPRKLVELRAVDGLYPLYGETVLAPSVTLSEALAFTEGVWGAAVEGSLLRRLDLAVGDLLKVGDTSYRVRTVLEREPDRTNRAFALGPRVMVAFDSLAGSELLQPGSLAHYHYRLRLPEAADVLALRQELDATFPEAGWRIRDFREASPGVRRFIERVTLFLTLVGLASLLVGGVGIGNAVRSYLDGKTATIATLKCIGASGRLIFRVYLTQILSLSLLGIAVGLTVGGLAPLVVGAVLGDQLGWRTLGGVYPMPLAVGAAFGVLTTLAFSLWPIARAQSVPAASLFRDKVAPGAGPRPHRLADPHGDWALCLAAGGPGDLERQRRPAGGLLRGRLGGRPGGVLPGRGGADRTGPPGATAAPRRPAPGDRQPASARRAHRLRGHVAGAGHHRAGGPGPGGGQPVPAGQPEPAPGGAGVLFHRHPGRPG
jgi:putative ABC transport system permease protein